jgi:mRNA-degrading endonuclease toxin of MazEF toxin-antitoxin module
VREKEGRAALNQIRVFDKKRLINKIGTLGSENFLEIKMAFLNLYGS